MSDINNYIADYQRLLRRRLMLPRFIRFPLRPYYEPIFRYNTLELMFYRNNNFSQRLRHLVNRNSGHSAENQKKRYHRKIIQKYLMTRDCRKSETEEKKEICVVCYEKFGEEEIFKRLDCGHDYHYKCIRKWLLLKNSCPLCVRTVIPSDFESV